MSKNKIHYARNGFVVGVGEIPGSTNFVEVDGDEVQIALNSGKSASVVDGQIVITESRAGKWSEIRAARDLLLAGSDVEILKINDIEAISGHIDVELRQRLAQYRQDLRDLTTQSDPFNISWPTWSSI
ncbi:phage tail assembly chaperone [Pseudomonas asiatica]|uniref:Phage tail assembly chaperone n=1 Tax=Pseudomonas asiatica TaxID=2219225 RepID=A0AAJ5LLS7_9PSED|nr:phage tail assembly chaperone [Pseudomonas asiatica]UUC20541.1 phage tail assembly chaperone [Pseudomonas asiatica]